MLVVIAKLKVVSLGCIVEENDVRVAIVMSVVKMNELCVLVGEGLATKLDDGVDELNTIGSVGISEDVVVLFVVFGKLTPVSSKPVEVNTNCVLVVAILRML